MSESNEEMGQNIDLREAIEAGIQLKRTDAGGDYFRGVADGVLLRFDAVKRMFEQAKDSQIQDSKK